jgi:hypothetical protein
MMQSRSVSWPVHGDLQTFRRRSAVLAAVCALVVVTPLALAAYLEPASVRPAIPLALGLGMLAALWIHGAARTSARRTELERSFAGLAVVHHGAAYRVGLRPVLGAYATRRAAATAALERGGWAIVVRAWDRYWLLAATPLREGEARRDPVSFRSRAVADVIPAVRVDAIA